MSTHSPKPEANAVLPIAYGTSALKLKKPINQNTHKWTVFVRSTSPAGLEQAVQSVTFKLHESFPNPVRIITSPPFEVTESGWGEFVIQIKVSFKNSRFKPLSLSHQLHLHHPLNANPKPDTPVVSQVFDEIIFCESSAAEIGFQTEHQPPTDPEALRELERLDKAIAHFENLLEGSTTN